MSESTPAPSDPVSLANHQQRKATAKAIVIRMMQAWGVSDYKSLAQKLALNPLAPSNWIQKASVPQHAILSCHQQTGKTLDWLYNGEEAPMRLSAKQHRLLEQKVLNLLKHNVMMGMLPEIPDPARQYLVTGLVSCLTESLESPER